MEPHVRYEDERWEGVDLTGLEAEAVELREARLEGAVLDGCRLAGLRGALSLRGTRMRWADILELAGPFAAGLEIALIED